MYQGFEVQTRLDAWKEDRVMLTRMMTAFVYLLRAATRSCTGKFGSLSAFALRYNIVHAVASLQGGQGKTSGLTCGAASNRAMSATL